MTWFRQISARADRSIFRFLVAVATGLLGAAVIAIGMTVWWLRSDAISDATNDTGNLATVLAEQTNLAVQSIDLVLNEIQVRLENLGATTDENYRHLEQDKNTYHALLDSLPHLSQAGLIALIDRNGRVLVTTQKWPSPGVDVSDRDYFSTSRMTTTKASSSASPSPIAPGDCRRFSSASASTTPATHFSE